MSAYIEKDRPTHDLESLPEKEDPIKRFEENHQRPRIQLPPEYLEKLIRKRYSLNSIKFYYEKVAGLDKQLYYLERPKKIKGTSKSHIRRGGVDHTESNPEPKT